MGLVSGIYSLDCVTPALAKVRLATSNEECRISILCIRGPDSSPHTGIHNRPRQGGLHALLAGKSDPYKQ
jgi:hypothetical protein